MDSPRTANAPFDATDTDIVLRTSDNVDFHVFKIILSLASPVFKDMFTIPQPSSHSDVVHISEDSSTIEILLLFCYPVVNPLIKDLEEAGHLLEAARKYDIAAVSSSVKTNIISMLDDNNAVSVYGFACQHNWQAEAQAAAFRTLQLITPGHTGVSLSAEDLNMMTTADYHRLLVYHDRCGKEAANLGKQLDCCKCLAPNARPYHLLQYSRMQSYDTGHYKRVGFIAKNVHIKTATAHHQVNSRPGCKRL
ncbi:hypothetical protein CONPUDRAFT_58140 [Coniophora puteana RWD-64-598 SS2]|uniref:BTB domain-containing protein n=1 Tax=Coniophora puteana (strain RWD-64-598) TaxID=741705 RepID=A0A5M3ML06_CONPW|nr:uncharacterized protein CONPUDRAFT_58140 [Coniophora puteana RWD-64-598 SS2]EIW79746.1 hypothetical protein CONPUDRAFT_58140 [Coniophora puteana RWD-64-598 SS2]